MPYIKEPRRKALIDDNEIPQTAGELNFLFTAIGLSYILDKGESYQTFNDIMGALEGAKLELYRRKIASYEDDKIEENGDVY